MNGKFRIGAKVFLKNDLGDHYGGKSVVVLRNTVGKVTEFFPLESLSSNHGEEMVRITVKASPGQPSLTCRRSEWDTFWSLTPMPNAPIPGAPPGPRPQTAWTRLMQPDAF